ncbi:hypothetical protein KKB43_06890 [Patescibacteria group bacterium]|nr:hypothetical protein [Patescibacteria group bacterium]
MKIKKTDFSRFLLEITVYFIAFIVTLLGYKLFFGINRFFFPEELYPSIVGVFASTLVLIYILFKFAILLINKKRPAWEIENKIYAIPVKALDFINPTDQDFQKFFMIFVVVNFIIIGALLSGLPDAFSFKKKLYVDRSFENELLAKENKLINTISGNENFKYNMAKSLEFVRLTNPHYHQQIVENTDHLAISDTSMSMALASANPNNFTITFDTKYGIRKYETITEYLALSTILVHESQHLKDFRMIKSDDGFNTLIGYLGGELYFKIICNPVTNYENFRQIMRATSMSFDEWCAQIEETKFFRMYNIDYENNKEVGEIFSK